MERMSGEVCHDSGYPAGRESIEMRLVRCPVVITISQDTIDFFLEPNLVPFIHQEPDELAAPPASLKALKGSISTHSTHLNQHTSCISAWAG